MNLNNVVLEVSAVSKKQYPKGNLPEIALCGRSNVGKSSLINKLLNRRNFARVSSSPGKTATINFYNIDNKIRIVDLPGYGYAKRSDSEKQKWAKMIDEYLSQSENLLAVAHLVDIRHKPSKDDITMQNWIKGQGGTPIVIMTKLDKLKKSEVTSHMQTIVSTLGLPESAVIIPFSSSTGDGREALLALIENIAQTDEERTEEL